MKEEEEKEVARLKELQNEQINISENKASINDNGADVNTNSNIDKNIIA